MNNQFATQFLLQETEDEYSSLETTLRELGTSEDAIKVLMSGVRTRNITPEGAIEIAKLTVSKVREMSTVGGGVAGGPTAATFTPGAGEQMATTKAFKKKKYQENTFKKEESLEKGDRVKIMYGKRFFGHTGTVKSLHPGYIVVDIDGNAGSHIMLYADVEKIDGNLDEDTPRLAGAKKAFGKKKKYQEGTFEDDEIAIFDGGEDGLTKIYKKADGTFYGVNDEFDFTAKDEQELLRKVAMWGYKLLSGTIYEDAPRLAGDPSKTNKQGTKNLTTYKNFGFTKAPSAEEAGKYIKGVDVKMLWKEGEEPVWQQVEPLAKALADRNIPRDLHGEFFDYLKEKLRKKELKNPQDVFDLAFNFLEMLKEGLNESRAYHKFKKEAATRSRDQQMHEAVKMIHKRLEEVTKLLEYAQQMRAELSEGEQTLEYNHNTKKVFERINSKVVEIYSKTRQLK